MTLPPEHEQLVETLLMQDFGSCHDQTEILERFRKSVQEFVLLDNSMAVLSDFRANKSYIHSGGFGQFFGIEGTEMIIDSAFEEDIFKCIHPDDLRLRHLLELRYFDLQKSVPANERHRYSTHCKLRAQNHLGNYVYISHRTLYPVSLPDGSIWLALCIYAPLPYQQPIKGIDGSIVDTAGNIIATETTSEANGLSLSPREVEVLALIAGGRLSKQIADHLSISVNTVNRHRQNILQKLEVNNFAEATNLALRTGLINEVNPIK
nr:LuxR C-terminal-related transcriptional regulator [uncultured Flavobacterium sp.]